MVPLLLPLLLGRVLARVAWCGALLTAACGGLVEPVEADACSPADRDSYTFELHELGGECGARGFSPTLDGCEPTALRATSPDGCALSESYTCPRPDGVTAEIDMWTRALDADAELLVGTAEVTILAPVPESFGSARVLCWGRYSVEARRHSIP